MNLDEEIDYLSSIESNQPIVDIVQQDEADLPVLKAVLRDLDESIAQHKSIDSLSLGDQVLTIEQQLTVNKVIVTYLSNFKLAIEKVIDDVREKYNG